MFLQVILEEVIMVWRMFFMSLSQRILSGFLITEKKGEDN